MPQRDKVAGDRAPLERLMASVYGELHKMAKRYMGQESPGHTLQTTALINEAYLNLAGTDQDWESRAHFFGVAAKAMRHVLVDHARRRKAAKRGGEVQMLPLEEASAVSGGVSPEIIALDDALTELAKLDARKAQVVELRYFGGLSVEETAKVMKISRETVLRDWQFARAFL